MSRPTRRTVLQAGLTLGLGFRTSAMLAVSQDDAASLRPREGDLLVRLDGSRAPLAPADVPLGGRQTMAWAFDSAANVVRNGTRLNQIMLLRFDPSALAPDTRARAAEGVVAYTAICTHNGCDVEDWLPAGQQLSCACHESIFDPKDGANVIDGPAPRALPALPLKIFDGKLAVAGPFTSRVGFEPG